MYRAYKNDLFLINISGLTAKWGDYVKITDPAVIFKDKVVKRKHHKSRYSWAQQTCIESLNVCNTVASHGESPISRIQVYLRARKSQLVSSFRPTLF